MNGVGVSAGSEHRARAVYQEVVYKHEEMLWKLFADEINWATSEHYTQ